MNQLPQGPTRTRLEDQLSYYSRRATHNQRWYIRIKVAQVIAAATIPLLAGRSPLAVAGLTLNLNAVAAVLGALIAALEGVQQLNQHHQLWITYRAVAEALCRERHLFEVGVSPYANPATALANLAQRMETIMDTERTGWMSLQERVSTGTPERGDAAEPATAPGAHGLPAATGAEAESAMSPAPPSPPLPA